ncbi:unnamed protein product [Moneuplotes crassus]|uniref:Uncharacterized protein n=1 Tax=Euplotes crassus TaxID=5936 RepID=A0AAD2D5E3_EUPCR|nr:unnamed protein product [Moneuplotes crassus]
MEPDQNQYSQPMVDASQDPPSTSPITTAPPPPSQAPASQVPVPQPQPVPGQGPDQPQVMTPSINNQPQTTAQPAHPPTSEPADSTNTTDPYRINKDIDTLKD